MLLGRVIVLAETGDGVVVPTLVFKITAAGPRKLAEAEATRVAEEAGRTVVQDPVLDAVLALRDAVVAVSAVASNIALREPRFPVDALRDEAQRRLDHLVVASTGLRLGEEGEAMAREFVESAEAELRGQTPGAHAAGWSILNERGIKTPDSLAMSDTIDAVASLALHRRTG